jgi:hypothetical protein
VDAFADDVLKFRCPTGLGVWKLGPKRRLSINSQLQPDPCVQILTPHEWPEADFATDVNLLEIIRAAAQHDYPVADIDDMLAEIERGYGTGAHP